MQAVKNSNVKLRDQVDILEREKDLALSYLDIAGVMIFVLDKKGVIKMVNKKTCDVLGCTKADVKGKNWFSNFSPSHLAADSKMRFDELMEGREPENFYECMVPGKDKEERLIFWHISLTKDPNGKINGAVCSGEDITDRRKIQNELINQSRNSEFLYLLARSISDTTDIRDLVQKAAGVLAEYPDILGGKIYVFAPGSTAKVTEERIFWRSGDISEKTPQMNSNYYIYNLLESNINCIEKTLLINNGQEQEAYSCAFKMNTNYETMGVLIVFCARIDATFNNFLMQVSDEIGRAIKRKQIELAIKESEEKFTTIFNFVPDALTISGIENSHFLEVNKGFEELTGHSRETALNRSALKLNAWVRPEERQTLIDKVLIEGKVNNFLTTLRKTDGSEFTAMFSAALIYLNSYKCMLTSVRDVSDQIKFQDEILSTKELLEKITFTTPSFISLYDENNDKIIYFNKSVLESLGYSKGDLEVINNLGSDGKKYFYHPEDKTIISDFTEKLASMNKGEVAKIEYRIKDSKSSWQWFQHSAAIFQKATEKLPLLTVNVFENISERKAAEERLIKHDRETELLFEAGKHISGTLDLHLIYDRMYNIISQVADCSELIVVKYEPKKQEIIYEYLRGKSIDSRVDVSKIPPIPLAPKGFGIVSQVIRSGESVIIDDYKEKFKKVKTTYVINQEGELSKNKDEKEGTESPSSAMVIPIKLENKILGAVQIYSKRLAAYNNEQLRFVESLMHQVALANKNATVFEQAQHEISERKAAEEKLRKSEKNLRQFAESVPDVLFRLDCETMKFSFLSPVIESMLGYFTEEVSSDPMKFFKRICYRDDFESAKIKLSDYVKYGRVEAPLNIELRVVSKDIRTVWVRITIKFEYRGGKIHSVIGAVSDITKEKLMEELRRTTDEKIIRYQSTLLELSKIGTDEYESFGKITEYVGNALKINRASIWLFKGDGGKVVCRDLFISTENSHQHELKLNLGKYPALMKKLRSDTTIINGILNRESDVNRFAKEILIPHGTLFTLICPIINRGKVTGSFCLESDDPARTEWTPEEIDFAISATSFVTLAIESHERKLAEEEIKKSLKDKEMLLREIHHRVKNNLQVISSMLYLQAAKSNNPAMIEGLVESQNRVKSMVMIHEKLYRSQNLSSFNYTEYIRDLTNSLFRSYRLESSRIELDLDIGDIMLDTDTAVHCGLIINELVSNSMKHAFPDNAQGVISIKFHNVKDNEYKLVVSDTGIGIADKTVKERPDTLGMQLIHTLVEQLDGVLDISTNNGSTFTINFSLKNNTALS